MNEGFPLSWKRLPLSALSQRIRRRNTIGNKNVLTISAIHGLVNQRSFFNKIVASKDLSNYFLLNKGEFAYNKSYSTGYPVGVVRKLDRYDTGVLSPLYICFGMSSRNVDTNYAQFFFDSQSFIDEINGIAKEGARNHGLLNVGVEDFFSLSFILPPLPEQKKIATILSSVDEVIEKTRAQIEKLKDLKTGMMQELLTKGIGHTEFKDSPVGRIPVEWDTQNLCNLVNTSRPITYGIVQTGQHMEDGTPCVRVVDLVRRELQTKNMIRTSPTINQQYRRTILQAGDIMFALRGNIGHVRIADKNLEGVNLTRGVALISPKDTVSNEYLLWSLRSPGVRTRILDSVNGSALQEIPLSNLRKICIPVPSLPEQIKLAEAMNSVEYHQNMVENALASLTRTKTALMQDLLTGKVRVNVNQEEAATA